MAIDKDKTARVNIFMSKELKQWYKDKSKETGISMSAFMAIALSEYKDQKDTIDLLKKMNIQELISQVNKE